MSERDQTNPFAPTEQYVDEREAEILALRARVAKLEEALETERMRLGACGLIANANTVSSAEEQRKMHPDYWSASCGDVAKAVDREIALRARVAKLEAALKVYAAFSEPQGRIARAALSETVEA